MHATELRAGAIKAADPRSRQQSKPIVTQRLSAGCDRLCFAVNRRRQRPQTQFNIVFVVKGLWLHKQSLAREITQQISFRQRWALIRQPSLFANQDNAARKSPASQALAKLRGSMACAHDYECPRIFCHESLAFTENLAMSWASKVQ